MYYNTNHMNSNLVLIHGYTNKTRTDQEAQEIDSRTQGNQRSRDGHLNKWCWDNWDSHVEKNLTRSVYYSTLKINCKWIRDLNVKVKPYK